MGPELIVWIFHLLVWLAGLLILWQIPLCRKRPFLAAQGISVIVPARNEEKNLPRLLGSLTEQNPPPDEIIVVDDHSTDRTAEIARQLGASVLAAEPLPAGWTGKTWACHQGAQTAKGPVLIFMDADTWLEEDGLSRMASAWEDGKGSMSVVPFHCIEEFYEQFSVVFNVVMAMSMNAFAAWSRNARSAGLYGQFLMVSKENYFRAGGHESVREHILGNLHLAARFRNAGIPVRCLGGEGSLGIRMYPDGFSSLMHGWRKAFGSGASCTPGPLLILIILWLSVAAGTFVMLALAPIQATGTGVAWLLLYLLFVVQMRWSFRRMGRFPFATAIFYPLFLFFFFFISALPRKTEWKGRSVAVMGVNP